MRGQLSLELILLTSIIILSGAILTYQFTKIPNSQLANSTEYVKEVSYALFVPNKTLKSPIVPTGSNISITIPTKNVSSEENQTINESSKEENQTFGKASRLKIIVNAESELLLTKDVLENGSWINGKLPGTIDNKSIYNANGTIHSDGTNINSGGSLKIGNLNEIESLDLIVNSDNLLAIIKDITIISANFNSINYKLNIINSHIYKSIIDNINSKGLVNIERSYVNNLNVNNAINGILNITNSNIDELNVNIINSGGCLIIKNSHIKKLNIKHNYGKVIIINSIIENRNINNENQGTTEEISSNINIDYFELRIVGNGKAILTKDIIKNASYSDSIPRLIKGKDIIKLNLLGNVYTASSSVVGNGELWLGNIKEIEKLVYEENGNAYFEINGIKINLLNSNSKAGVGNSEVLIKNCNINRSYFNRINGNSSLIIESSNIKYLEIENMISKSSLVIKNSYIEHLEISNKGKHTNIIISDSYVNGKYYS
ncbi:hypothetical protein J422_01935 [Methanocaldococcus villosus KIN24-T80]|uniref:Uncharacterized protein n=1 Tax=Methanocaldococcus villosus KIN24-T80 TaxID=1069083 RepID=N6UW35_9EURY|nr:hypothetical protein [Methanocaldococcus villosus]ENN96534.1 hypothetical protein J422_01935 [Methanocaldococcus villosus KIN24-T80]